MTNEKRYRKSAPGDFYIEMHGDENDRYGSCCTAGGAPHLSTPQFCTYDEGVDEQRFCYVHTQPQSDYEIYQMIRSAWVSEFGCLRYGGNDQDTLQRFIDVGLAQSLCDEPLPEGVPHKLRNYCSIKGAAENPATASEIAVSLQEFLLNQYEWLVQYSQTTEPEMRSADRVSFEYTWTANRKWRGEPMIPIFHQISVKPYKTDFSDCLLTHSPVEQNGSISLSFSIDDFLRNEQQFEQIRWCSEAEWNEGSPTFWRETPY